MLDKLAVDQKVLLEGEAGDLAEIDNLKDILGMRE